VQRQPATKHAKKSSELVSRLFGDLGRCL